MLCAAWAIWSVLIGERAVISIFVNNRPLVVAVITTGIGDRSVFAHQNSPSLPISGNHLGAHPGVQSKMTHTTLPTRIRPVGKTLRRAGGR
jgi:hypothetical protein